jgi:hypothetical protein
VDPNSNGLAKVLKDKIMKFMVEKFSVALEASSFAIIFFVEV